MRAAFRLFVLGMALMVPGAALAAWPNLSTVNLPVASGPGLQVYPSVLADGAGGAFVAWHDNRGPNYDLYVQRLSFTGAALWTPNGLAVCTATGDQANAQLAPDGAGGVIVTWHDFRGGTWDIYAQRLDGNGVPQWTPNGVAVCTALNNQTSPQVVTDGAGGGILVWTDLRAVTNTDIYAQRVNAAGVTQWGTNGVPVCTFGGEQTAHQMVSDGAGGAILAWQDSRSGVYDIYAQRLNGAGAGLWTAQGKPVVTATANQGNPAVAADGFGGAVIAWWDERAG
ncbi:MAG TPA: hypothetical protein VJ816_06350, partial [Gemmatimonadales bacterium]|nr:hypothetical protein [Gemmatimonadales bacterium]